MTNATNTPQQYPNQPPEPRRKTQQVEPILLDTAELATLLNMSTTWVYREAGKLGLRGYKLGRGRNAKVHYRKSEVLAWLEQQRLV
ncbi:DNA-binding protein [Streptomyces sp. WAC04770]|nr:helix-turn-helix domain-containing protein [Streptomyces sp. WAC04770]RST20456.1 DNA-binding protein [Streptomyces sp. WAC04770]